MIPDFPRVPRGLAQIKEQFGDIAPFIRADGTLSSQWEVETQTIIKIPFAIPLSYDLATKVTKIRIHVKLKDVVAALFQEAKDCGMQGLFVDYGGSFEWRKNVNNSKKITTHAWAIALDINANKNPNNKKPKQPAALVELFEKYHFYWLGREPKPDGMHFQYARGY